MPELNDKIEVRFLGALKSSGRILLKKPATIKSGLDAVGGLAPAEAKMWPAGVINVRRKQNGRMVHCKKFDMADRPANWEHFELQDGDAVIFQWHVVMNDAVKNSNQDTTKML